MKFHTENNERIGTVFKTILKLANQVFVFATHLHQLPEIEEIPVISHFIYLLCIKMMKIS